jgi:hypothetical protein
MVERYRHILTQLPNPVPKGEDRHAYFNANCEKWIHDGLLEYGSYQLGMIVDAWDDSQRPAFSEEVRLMSH